VFENRLLRMIFGPKKDEVKGEWRRPHNEELNDLYSSPDIRAIEPRRMRWAGYVARKERSGAYRGLVGKLSNRDQFGDPGGRWEDHNMMDLQDVGSGPDWSGSDSDWWRALVNAVMILRVP
jgi:hypothetical protein